MNPPSFRRLSGLLVVIMAAVMALPMSQSADAARDGATCYRVVLDQRPHWISAALGESSQVIVVDSWGADGRRLLSYSPRGEATFLPTVEGYGESDFTPVKIAHTDGSGFLLMLADGTTLQLDEQLRAGDHEMALQERAGDLRLGSMYQFTVAGDTAVAYGALLTAPKDFELGVFRAPLRSVASEKLTMLEPFDDSEFYLIGSQYLTTIGEDAYFVRMSKRPAIYRVGATGRVVTKLAAFPQEYSVRPDFKTRMTGPKTAKAHFAELETFTVPAGLYSQGGMLYLLGRKPDPPRGTAWWLYEIDPRSDRIVGRVRLPTSANHVTLAPSETAWYLFERGSVGENQRQEIATMVVLPSSAVAALSLPASCPMR